MKRKYFIRYKQDLYAQVGLYDALLFFIILIIASAGILLASINLSDVRDIEARQQVLEYTDISFNSIMQCTLHETSYFESGSGNNENDQIALEDKTITYLLLFDLMARYHNTAVQTSSGKILPLEDDLEEVFDNTIDERFNYILELEYEPVDLIVQISSQESVELPNERYTASEDFDDVEGLPGKTTITLYIWRK